VRRRAISDAHSSVVELLAHRAWDPPPNARFTTLELRTIPKTINDPEMIPRTLM
jgi:hypothetical protein